MIISIKINNHSRSIDLSNPVDISIPLNFNGEQPNAYGVEMASARPVKSGELVGDTRSGGSCNFEQYKLIPHCNGTHTECVGHITHERTSVRDCLQDVFVPALLVTVEPEKAGETNETYAVQLATGDRLITRKTLQAAVDSEPVAGFHSEFRDDSVQPPATAGGTDRNGVPTALIIRTLPNDESKLTRQYVDIVPPYFSTEAIQYIVGLGVKHLLADLPSIDRLYDKGKLSNHRIFWNIAPGSFETNEQTRINSTITELIYVPNEIEDGEYLLNLQIAPFAADAAPSRPILFRR